MGGKIEKRGKDFSFCLEPLNIVEEVGLQGMYYIRSLVVELSVIIFSLSSLS